jgi:hypothetical protein
MTVCSATIAGCAMQMDFGPNDKLGCIWTDLNMAV